MKINFNLSAILLSFSMLFPSFMKGETKGIQFGETEAEFFQAPSDKASGKTVLILPGGGYAHHAMDHEGYDWVPYFNNQGINVAILKYMLPEGNSEIPFNEVKKTFNALKEKAGEWNINPNDIGIMGFSAGGHLASTYATHAKGEDVPAFQILFYPVVSMKEGITHRGSRDNLLGKDQNYKKVIFYSNEEQVDSSTPPAIIFHSNDDGAVVPDNSINYYMALNKAGVPASLHIYPVGGHGWGFRESFPYHGVMLEELAVWLSQQNKKQ